MADIVDYQGAAKLKAMAMELFSARTPITTQDLFAGRYDQIQKLHNAIAQKGAHAIVYGERGVGKTSLANIAPISYCVHYNVGMHRVVAPRINCDGTDSFDDLWRKVFRAVRLTNTRMPIGFLEAPQASQTTLLQHIEPGMPFTPGLVQQALQSLGQQCQVIITLDEFDRLPAGEVPRLVADTIKSLSDNVVPATLVLVGVGDSINTLVHGHESVGRHVIEVPLPRMRREEVEKILTDRLKLLDEMEIEEEALKTISLVCTGLPYFAHLLGFHAVSSALNSWSPQVKERDVQAAMGKAIEDSEREMISSYYAATQSRQPSSTFSRTLAACALTQRDDFGYFTAASVREALAVITGNGCQISTFLPHLDRFAEKDKGGILESAGAKHQRRFRFRDPLMQPFVIIRSLDDKVITVEHIRQLVH